MKERVWLQHKWNFCEKCKFFDEERQECMHEDFVNVYQRIVYGKSCTHFFPK